LQDLQESSLPVTCVAGARAVETGRLITNSRHRLSTLRNLLKVVEQSMWLWSIDATFHKAVLNYCRHDGFPCHRNTSHGIQDVPLSYVFFGNLPVCFSHKKTYRMLSVHSFHTTYDALVQWLHVDSRCKRCACFRVIPSLWTVHWSITRSTFLFWQAIFLSNEPSPSLNNLPVT
jgi:hypothetical protein